MALTFAGIPIRGIHGPVVEGSPSAQTIRAQYWDLSGETEIVGQLGGRDLSCRVLMYGNYTTVTAIKQALRAWQKRVGQHGTLIEVIDGESIPFEFCTLDAVMPIPFGSQEEAGPMEDIGNTLDGGWWMHVEFKWHQLKV